MPSALGASLLVAVFLALGYVAAEDRARALEARLVEREARLLESVSDAAIAWVSRHRHAIVSCVRDRRDDNTGRSWANDPNHGRFRNAMFAEVEVPFFERFRGLYRRPLDCPDFPTLESENALPAGVRDSPWGGEPAGMSGLRFAASVTLTNDGARRRVREDTAGAARFETGAATLQLWVAGFPAWTGTLDARDSLAEDGGYEMARVLDQVDSPYWGASVCDGTQIRLGSFDARTASTDFDENGFGNDWNPPGASGAFGAGWNTQIAVCPSGVAYQQPPVPSLGDRVPALAYRVTFFSGGRASPGQSNITTNVNRPGFERMLFGSEAMRVGSAFPSLRDTTLPRGFYLARVDDGQLAQAASGGAPVVDCSEGLLWTAASRAACGSNARDEGEWNRVRGDFYVDGVLHVGADPSASAISFPAVQKGSLPDAIPAVSDASGGYALRLGRLASDASRGVIRGRYARVASLHAAPADLVFGSGAVRTRGSAYVDRVLRAGFEGASSYDPMSQRASVDLSALISASSSGSRHYVLSLGRVSGVRSRGVIRGGPSNRRRFAGGLTRIFNVPPAEFSFEAGSVRLRGTTYAAGPGAAVSTGDFYVDGAAAVGRNPASSLDPQSAFPVSGLRVSGSTSVGPDYALRLGYVRGHVDRGVVRGLPRRISGVPVPAPQVVLGSGAVRTTGDFYVDGVLSTARYSSAVDPLSLAQVSELPHVPSRLVASARGYALRVGREPVSGAAIPSVYLRSAYSSGGSRVSHLSLGPERFSSHSYSLYAPSNSFSDHHNLYLGSNTGFSVWTVAPPAYAAPTVRRRARLSSSFYGGIALSHYAGSSFEGDVLRARPSLASGGGCPATFCSTSAVGADFGVDAAFNSDVDFSGASEVDFETGTGRIFVRRPTIFTRAGGAVQVRGGMRFDGRSASDASVLDMTDAFAGVRAAAATSPVPTPSEHTARLYYKGRDGDSKHLQLGLDGPWTPDWGTPPPSPTPPPAPGTQAYCQRGGVTCRYCPAEAAWRPRGVLCRVSRGGPLPLPP